MNPFLKFFIFFFASSSLNAHEISSPSFKGEVLYPPAPPFHENLLQVSDLHQIFYSEYGNPDGTPVLVVHGGPGAGCSSNWSHFFDLNKYHVIMFDQRGAMRSIPFAEMEENTPEHSIEDMEALRTHLDISQWYLFGGSWGSTLSLLYSEAYPERVSGLVLRGIFLARKKDYMNLFYGMGNTYPEAWDAMVQTIGADKSCDLVAVLHEKVMDPDPEIHMNAARAFMLFDTICAFLNPNQAAIEEIQTDDALTLSIARAFIHYAANHFFIEENQILQNIHKIKHIPTIIVQGRYDIICPMSQAYELYNSLPRSNLWIIQDAGHSSSEPSVAVALKKAMDMIYKIEYLRCSDH